mmetsp:Transcript_36791/g.118700  ORF Transcript_36791/g.118700 Transcript_36791/m.118700 type:complete len:205 (+) Transcript_36791:1120-1734(+)
MPGRRPAAGGRGGGLNVAPGLEELAGLGAGVRGDREGARQRAGQHPEADRHVGGGHIRDLGLERDVEARAEGGTVGEGGVGVRELEADETARRGHRGLVLLRDAAREAQVQDQVGIHELVVHAAHQQAVAERDRDGVPLCVHGRDGHTREDLHAPDLLRATFSAGLPRGVSGRAAVVHSASELEQTDAIGDALDFGDHRLDVRG